MYWLSLLSYREVSAVTVCQPCPVSCVDSDFDGFRGVKRERAAWRWKRRDGLEEVRLAEDEVRRSVRRNEAGRRNSYLAIYSYCYRE